MYETITFNTVSRAKRIVRNGRAVWVADATIIVPGVLNGSQGSLYYPDEHVKRHVPDWNGMPLVVYHPTRNGQPVSGRDPSVLEEWGVGNVWGSEWDGTKNVVQAHFDEDSVKRIDARLREQKGPLYNAMLPRLEKGLPIELSTGLYTDNIPANNGSNHKGKPYTHVAVNYRPDHLAVLPDQRGACSIDDGCGINVNSTVELLEFVTTDNTQPAGKFGNFKHTATGKFVEFGAGLGHGEHHDAAVDGYKGPRTCPECGGKLNADDECQACKEAYKSQTKAVGAMATANQLEIEDMDRKTNIGWLVANCDCWKGKERILNGAVDGKPLFTDEELVALKANVEKGKQNALVANAVAKGTKVNGQPFALTLNSTSGLLMLNAFPPKAAADAEDHGPGGDMGADEATEDEMGNPIKPKRRVQLSATEDDAVVVKNQRNKTMTLKDWEASMPPEAKAIWNATKQAHDDMKMEIAGKLVANISNDEERQQVGNELMEKHDLAGLRTLLKLVRPTQNRVEREVERPAPRQFNFVGAGGGPGNDDRNDNEDVEILDLPVMNWGKSKDDTRANAAS